MTISINSNITHAHNIAIHVSCTHLLAIMFLYWSHHFSCSHIKSKMIQFLSLKNEWVSSPHWATIRVRSNKLESIVDNYLSYKSQLKWFKSVQYYLFYIEWNELTHIFSHFERKIGISLIRCHITKQMYTTMCIISICSLCPHVCCTWIVCVYLISL